MPVYFIGNGAGHVKIGYSKNPLSRLSALQTASPHQLNLLALKPGGADVEAELHAKYSCFRLEGEWFHLSKELQIEIAVNQKVYPIESFLNPSEKDKIIYDDAYAEWSSAVDKLHQEYDQKIERLEREIEKLESERDAKEEVLDQLFEGKTDGIYPWWLNNE